MRLRITYQQPAPTTALLNFPVRTADPVTMDPEGPNNNNSS